MLNGSLYTKRCRTAGSGSPRAHRLPAAEDRGAPHLPLASARPAHPGFSLVAWRLSLSDMALAKGDLKQEGCSYHLTCRPLSCYGVW